MRLRGALPGLLAAVALGLGGCGGVEELVPEVVASYPHDPTSFTQGLVWRDGRLFESAGRYGASELREVALESGLPLRRRPLSATYFAEGLAAVDDRLIQLTWREGRAFVYDRDSFEVQDVYRYAGEGWGLCYDGERLYMSDGSARIVARDPRTFEELDSFAVTRHDDGAERPVERLNELECVGGHLWANVWQTDEIVRIRKRDGRVDAVLDARGLLDPAARAALAPGAVLNGIAYRPETETFLLTGKYWPTLFEVRLEPAPAR